MGYNVRPISVRFWRFVNKTPTCWLWTGSTFTGSRNQYGVIQHTRFIDGKRFTKAFAAHRLSWEIANGKIPQGMFVLHKCDVKLCVNPDHLFIGTHADNMKDMTDKGRHPFKRGEKHMKAKLTAEQVRAIRKLKGTMTAEKIGNLFGVTGKNVWCIFHGKSWSHLV